jgi:hypothetical protein
MSKVTLPFATIEYIEPIVYFRITREGLLNDKEILEAIDAGVHLCHYKPHLLLTDARINADLTPEARKAGANINNTTHVIAQAILVKWLAQRLIATVFMQVNKPHYPVRIFNNEGKAVKWLMEQKGFRML